MAWKTSLECLCSKENTIPVLLALTDADADAGAEIGSDADDVHGSEDQGDDVTLPTGTH
jgi:hypothetical protein